MLNALKLNEKMPRPEDVHKCIKADEINFLKKVKHQKTSSQEKREGTTYQTRIGLNSDNQSKVTNETLKILKDTITEEQFNSYSEALGDNVKETNSSPHTSKEVVFFVAVDLETTGLERSSEIIQVSCTSLFDTSTFNEYQESASSSTEFPNVTNMVKKFWRREERF